MLPLGLYQTVLQSCLSWPLYNIPYLLHFFSFFVLDMYMIEFPSHLQCCFTLPPAPVQSFCYILLWTDTYFFTSDIQSTKPDASGLLQVSGRSAVSLPPPLLAGKTPTVATGEFNILCTRRHHRGRPFLTSRPIVLVFQSTDLLLQLFHQWSFSSVRTDSLSIR